MKYEIYNAPAGEMRKIKGYTYLERGEICAPYIPEGFMNWEDNKLVAIHNGKQVEMGYIHESVLRDHEWFVVLKYGGVNESRLPFQTRHKAEQWLADHCGEVLKQWRKNVS